MWTYIHIYMYICICIYVCMYMYIYIYVYVYKFNDNERHFVQMVIAFFVGDIYRCISIIHSYVCMCIYTERYKYICIYMDIYLTITREGWC
jgi:hypothetical protein